MTPEDLPRSEFDELIGIRNVEIGPDRCVSLTELRSDLHQPFGVVHGGVYAAIVESLASIGANAWLSVSSGLRGGLRAVGVSNHTDFLRSARAGELRAEATPIQRGRTFQLWAVAVTDGNGRLCAHGKVRLANLTTGVGTLEGGVAESPAKAPQDVSPL
ncbi:MAG: PaaI family thioesterase [Egibacteraceae bacterium]